MVRLPVLWREPFSIASRMERMMDDFFKDFAAFPDWEFSPAWGRSDVYVKDKVLFIETELPGATKDDVQVRVEGDQLVIRGEIKRSEEVRDENYIRMGRRYGAFRRVFPLPEDVEDRKGIKARFANGILIVEVPLKRAPETEGTFEVKLE